MTDNEILQKAMDCDLGVQDRGVWIGFQAHKEWILKFAAQLAAPAPTALMNDVWAAAGGKAGDGATNEQIVAAVKALRDLTNKFTEMMIKQMSQAELKALLAELKA